MKKLYRAGIYCRLSVDDASNSAKNKNYIPADESVSIENQRELLSKFVMLNGWVETKVYCDDGYSGGNFQRPGFLEMLEDAQRGLINLILVKDLSRLGRDYVEVGRYTDIVFPSLGCRFVSVLDCLDSEGDNTDMLHFRSLMNDYHLRDLSGKIKSVLHSKMVSGQYISAYAPYGYRKSTEDKHKMVLDEYAAGVVRRIYELRLEGTSYGQIAAILNREDVPSPGVYRHQFSSKTECKVRQLWTHTAVKRILHREVYKGTRIMNYCGTRSYKDTTVIYKPESEWIRHEALHEAIVTEEEWDAVQKINQAASLRSVGRQAPTTKLFTGKLICSDCKSPMNAKTMTRRYGDGTSERYVWYFCGTYAKSGHSVCSCHGIYEKTVIQMVSDEIEAHAQAVTVNETSVVERLKHNIADYDEQRLVSIKQEISKLRRRVQELENMIAKLYEDKYSGSVSENTFMVLVQKNEQERLAKAERLDVLLSEVDRTEKETAAIRSWAAIIRKYLDISELDRTIIDELIDHIEIGERTIVDGQSRQDIKIFYRFVGQVGFFHE
ncbi:MAG: recombinase family protein [Oscillospiraceae bacterium]|nr:recombinase family protein [Oscillospiraceae bacterium]